MISASKQKDSKLLEELLQRPLDPNVTDADGSTPLHYAAQNGHLKSVQLLLEASAKKDVEDKANGHTPLHWASVGGHLDVVSFLIEAGADKEKASQDGTTALGFAAGRGHLAVVRFLLKAGADREHATNAGQTPLGIAATCGRLDVVRLLVESGAQTETPGRTPLEMAIGQGQPDVVRFLVEAGADIEYVRKTGQTPLAFAAGLGHLDIVRFLVESGCDIEKAPQGMSALMFAATEGQLDVVRFLVENGAKTEGNEDGFAPLGLAAGKGHLEVVRFLISVGAHKEKAMKDGPTALGWAVLFGHLEVVRLLVEHGAEMDPAALDLASQRGHERYRLIAVEPLMDGKPCNGTLKEIRPCTIAVDCVISPWTPWDQCDKSCDGGQKQRQRQVELNPKHGGKPCPLGLIETTGCNREPCDDKEVNCKVSIWSVWSRCSASCGPGVKERSRTVTNRLSHCGAGCVGNLTQVEPCYLEHCGGCDPCAWGDWREWSECDVHCGGGQRVRLRNITTWPSPGCPPCEAMNKEELGSCNLDPCPESELCVDGAWASWNDWEACSTSCEGGMRWRVRHVQRQATSCGREPSGDSREEEECNKGVPCKASQDCELSAWSVWSDCSASCHGIKKRERSVLQHGYGVGKYCEGVLEEAFPCALGISRSLEDWSSTHLYLNLGNVYANNLGGQGPDFQAEQSLRFKNAAADNAQSVDLRVTVAEESDYRPEKVLLAWVVEDFKAFNFAKPLTWAPKKGAIKFCAVALGDKPSKPTPSKSSLASPAATPPPATCRKRPAAAVEPVDVPPPSKMPRAVAAPRRADYWVREGEVLRRMHAQPRTYDKRARKLPRGAR
eukprot:s500_g6.t2